MRRPPVSVDRAEQLRSGGDYAGAAGVYERLAGQTTGADSAEFLLRAARAWFQAGRPADADRVLATLPPTLTQAQAVEQKLLRIQSAVAQGRGDEAWRDISAMQTPAAPQSAAIYYETRQQVAIATGHLVDGIRSELARERLIAPGEVNRARSELLGQLRAAADRGVSLAPPPGSDAMVRGWLEAAGVAADNLRNPTLGTTRLGAFRSRYPSHPALGALAGEPGLIVDLPPESKLENAPHIALMLPLSGRTAAASAQIRDGFMTAYYQLPANARPRLRVYDTATTSVGANIAAASGAGAEFIVGPLTREEVIASSELISQRPPILALNFLPPDRPAPERFYQFALSPEDDARAVARYIGASGKRRGVVHCARRRLGYTRRRRLRRGVARRRRLRARPVEFQRGGTGLSRQHHAGAAHRRQRRPPLAHPGSDRPEARIRAAPAAGHPVHLRAEPARHGAPVAAPAAFPSRRRHPDVYARRCLRTTPHREPGNRRRHVSGHAVDARRRGTSRGSSRSGARVRRARRTPRPAVRLRLRRLSHRHVTAAGRSHRPAGPHGDTEHGRAGTCAARARVGANQERSAGAARARRNGGRTQ